LLSIDVLLKYILLRWRQLDTSKLPNGTRQKHFPLTVFVPRPMWWCWLSINILSAAKRPTQSRARDGLAVSTADVGMSVPTLPTGGQGEVLLSTPLPNRYCIWPGCNEAALANLVPRTFTYTKAPLIDLPYQPKGQTFFEMVLIFVFVWGEVKSLRKTVLGARP
jgi:hypothetical protein